ncbi:MAG: hypothetical protein JWQ10_3041 [Herbaspirillum sp.]|nr:hypothetical protein [Herbaspirillum sp.]
MIRRLRYYIFLQWTERGTSRFFINIMDGMLIVFRKLARISLLCGWSDRCICGINIFGVGRLSSSARGTTQSGSFENHEEVAKIRNC